MIYAETRLSQGSPVLWPSHWRTVPLWSIFERVKDVDHPDDELLSVYREHGVVKREGRDDNFNKAALDRSIYQLVHPGWFVVNRMKAWQGSVGISSFRGIVSGHYICFRPTHGEDDRFLNWLLRSAPYTAEYASLSRGVRPNQVEIDNEWLRSLRIMLPPAEEQRRIADFLDAETARIDRLADARRRHLNLVEERWESTIYSELSESDAETVELRRLGAAVTTGPFGTVFNASEYEDGGIPMVNPLHIKNGQIHPDSHHSVSQATASRLSRHLLRSGDLVVGRKGDLGRAALVTDHQDGWVCGSDCIAVRPSSRLRASFLAYVLRSQYVRTQLLARSLAATMPSLSEGNLLSLRIPNFDLKRQEEATVRLDAAHDWFARAVTAMRSQFALLAEHRQALITAAVTGQFDVSTASGRNVTNGVTA